MNKERVTSRPCPPMLRSERVPAGRRFVELDLLRGLAVVGMVVFHFFFILDFYGVKESAMFSGWWHVLGQFVRFTFLGLVGVGMVISYERVVEQSKWQAILRQWRRALIVGIAAMIVTVATWMAVQGAYVRFGILHLIAVSIFFWSFFVEWKWVVLGLSLLSFWVGGWFEWLGMGGLDLSGLGNLWLAYRLIGNSWGNLGALDFFPIFPWIGIVGVGIFLGRMLYSRGGLLAGPVRGESSIGKGLPSFFSFLRSPGKILIFLGKKALMIYLLHVPMIVGVLWVMGYLE